ncbi:flagellar basal body-associated FliL family protein [Devosia pacifica]|nr:flagellar basal body-associated FliL family protein [Devosia pacifica]
MATDAEVQQAEPAGGKKKKMIIMGAAAGAVVLVAGAAMFFFMSPGAEEAAAESAEVSVPDTFIFNLPSMTVNLNNEGEGESYLQMTIALEVASEEVMTEIQPKLAKVIDAFQVYLRELRRSDLEGSAGIYRLKEELLRRVNTAIYPSHVESILFKELLVQ